MSEKTHPITVIENKQSIAKIAKFTYLNGKRKLSTDSVLIEQPLQIRLIWDDLVDSQPIEKSSVFSITMRTPGHDEELITGLLLGEGVIKRFSDISTLAFEQENDVVNEQTAEIIDPLLDDMQQTNLWDVRLSAGVIPKLASLERYQITYSSCGLCGSTSLKSLELKNPPQLSHIIAWLNPNTIYTLPDDMRKQQPIFNQTGGSHAAALYQYKNKDPISGVCQTKTLINLSEDIGRHNALDKLFGAMLKTQAQNKTTPNNSNNTVDNALESTSVVVISSRISFEIVQKTVMAGIPVLVGVGAPSSLAILAAKRFNLTLIAFTSNKSFNLYHGEWRLC